MNITRKAKRLDTDIKKWMVKELTPLEQVLCIIVLILLQIYVFSR